MLAGQLEEVGLDVVWVVLNLERGRLDLGVGEHVEKQGSAVVAHTNALSQALVLELLKCLPCALQAGIAVLDLTLAIVVPTRWVAHLGVDVLEGDGEVDEVQVEVVDAPVSKLLAADGLDLLAVVECLPELADNEEVFALYKSLLDGPGDTLTALDFVAVVCDTLMSVWV